MTISIHAPREGCDIMATPGFTDTIFQSTHPVRGATWMDSPEALAEYISIHAPREGCDRPHGDGAERAFQISIHAPREGCDVTITGMTAVE